MQGKIPRPEFLIIIPCDDILKREKLINKRSKY